MSHLLNSVNNVKSSADGNVNLGLSSLISSPSNTDILGIDASGDAKKLSAGSSVGDIVLSYVTQQGGWGGSPTVTEGYNIFMRGSSCTIEEDATLVTKHTLSNSFLTGWTLVAGNYLMMASWGFSTGGGGDCNAQFYDATAASYVGPKIHFETGNFSNRLIYYTSISSNTKFEIRARDVNSVGFFDSTSMFACTLQIFKL